MKGIKVTVEDLETGEIESKEVRPGDYVIVSVAPAYTSNVVAYKNGTHVITVKVETPPDPSKN